LIELPRGRRLRAERAGRDLDVLLLQRAGDVTRRDLPRRQALRIEPQPHRVLALAEDGDVADARHALQRVLDVDVDVVAEEERVVLSLFRIDAGRHDETGGLLADGDAKL